ncbi:MAG TPA: aspartyl-phosphate phosphatase Spo0E family protein [Pseudogracilibacillus sp.]|nr:aspartyl-phosphate phosphatase Spo0E family protein [Pseudogracilibacillus sp.]
MKKDLCHGHEIERLRMKLHEIVHTKEYTDEEVVMVSQQLDELINKWYEDKK